jgi:hypothetical protein
MNELIGNLFLKFRLLGQIPPAAAPASQGAGFRYSLPAKKGGRAQTKPQSLLQEKPYLSIKGFANKSDRNFSIFGFK